MLARLLPVALILCSLCARNVAFLSGKPAAIRHHTARSLRRGPLPSAGGGRNVSPVAGTGSGTSDDGAPPSSMYGDSRPAAKIKAKKRPFPASGDVVQFPTKWPGELKVGQIRNLQFIASRDEWLADILPLEDAGEEVYRAKQRVASVSESVASLFPLRATYVRSVDGFKIVTVRPKTGEEDGPKVFSRRADGYELDGFEPKKPVVDQEVVQRDLEAYDRLKRRLIIDTAAVGFAGAVVCALAFGLEEGSSFFVGALGSIAYAYLVGFASDVAGKATRQEEAIAISRFFVPVALASALALKRAFVDGIAPESAFRLLPISQFAPLMVGFLSYRPPLLVRELRLASEGVGDDLLAMLPGSVGASAKVAKGGAGAIVASRRAGDAGDERLDTLTLEEAASGVRKGRSGGDPDGRPRLQVMLVSGPLGAGRTDLVRECLRKLPNLCVVPRWLALDGAGGGGASEPLEEVSAARMATLEAEGAVLVTRGEGEGRKALTLQSVEDAAGSGKEMGLAERKARPLVVLELSAREAQQLMERPPPAWDLIGAWVSLDQMDKFEIRLRDVASRRPGGDDQEKVDTFVQLQLSAIVSDIEWALKSRLFDFTILNDDLGKSVDEMRKAIEVGIQTRNAQLDEAA